MTPLLTDRLADVVTDPRTVLTLLFWLWRPATVLVFAGLAGLVYLLILLGRGSDDEPPHGSRAPFE